MSEITTWLDTDAGAFHSAFGDPSMPTADDFYRAGQEEMRIEARRQFDLAHRPGEKPAAPYTTEELQHYYAARREQIYARGNWISGDAEIAEALRRVRVGREARSIAESAQFQSPGQPDPAQLEAYRRMNSGTMGVPRASE